VTLALGSELEAAAWFRLGSAPSRLDAEEQIRIAFNRVRWHDSVVLSKVKLSVLRLDDPRTPAPPEGMIKAGLRLLYGEATVVGYAPARDDVLGRPFLKTLTTEDVMLLREIAANAWRDANPGKPPLKESELDAAIEMMGPDVARSAILMNGR
jgi:hypothetical protein